MAFAAVALSVVSTSPFGIGWERRDVGRRVLGIFISSDRKAAAMAEVALSPPLVIGCW